MGFSNYTWELLDQKDFPFLPHSWVTIEVYVTNISFSRYYPATYENPAEGGDLENYDIEGVDVYDEDGDAIPITDSQMKKIVEWAHGRSDLEDAIHSADYDDYDYDDRHDRYDDRDYNYYN